MLSRTLMLKLAAALSSLLFCACIHAQQTPERLAQQSTESRLVLVGSGKYADSWQESASLFKAHVTKAQWASMVAATRDPLGKLVSRKLKSAQYTKTLPGAPDGEYVFIQYDTRFEHKQSAVETITPMLDKDGTETITPMLDKDGTWRVSGYFIK